MNQYQQLITSIYDKLDQKTAKDFFVNNSNFNRLEEHNLWTYWQGRGVRNPKIMVIGLDWGSVVQSNKYFEYIKNNPDAKVVSYMKIKEANPKMKENEFTTDKELQRFFENIPGCEDICNQQNKNLYFTNLILGFRSGSSSTGNNTEVKKAITDDVLNDFKKLLAILRPKIIICLGRLVSESIDKAYNGNQSIIAKTKSFNEFLDKELHEKIPQPIILDLGNGNQAKMFALAHMGSLGKANRTKANNKTDKKVIEYDKTKSVTVDNDRMNKKTVEDDWKVVAKYIKDNINLDPENNL